MESQRDEKAMQFKIDEPRQQIDSLLRGTTKLQYLLMNTNQQEAEENNGLETI
jgi:hypothetical protein